MVVGLVIVAAIVVGVLVSRMVRDDGRSDDARKEFLRDCMPGGGELLCRCVVDELEDELAPEEFRELRPEAFSETPPPIVADAIERCFARV